MSETNLAERCPFRRPKSASARIYAVLARASKPLPAEEVAKRSKVTEKQAKSLLAAYMNPYHNAPLRRVGVQITSEDGEFRLIAAKATPNAKRPPRGNASKKKKAKKATRAKPKPIKKARRKSAPKKPTAEKATPAAAVTPIVPDAGADVAAPEGEQSK